MSRWTSKPWVRRLRARWAAPQRVFVSPGGAEFTAWCEAHPGSAVELIVSARALHELVADPALPLDTLEAVQAYARQQFAHYFGGAAERYALAPWRLGGTVGASALHGLDLAALQAQARDAQVRLAAVHPAWAVWLASLPAEVRDGTGTVVWWEAAEDHVTAVALQLDQGVLRAVQPRRLNTRSELEQFAAGSRAQGSPSGDLTATHSAHSAHSTRSTHDRLPDFVVRPIRSALAWPLAAAGALVLAVAVFEALQSHAALDGARAGLALAQRLPAGARPATARPAARGAVAPVAPVATRPAADARPSLEMPWEALFSRVEGAGHDAPGVAWLGLEASAARGELRLDGLTPDRLLALRLAEDLGTTPGWQQVVLSRFSAAEPGLTGQRFEITARVPTGSPP